MERLPIRLEIPHWGLEAREDSLGPFRVEWEAGRLSLMVGSGERADLMFRMLRVLVGLNRIQPLPEWGAKWAPNGTLGFRFSSFFPEVIASMRREIRGTLGRNRFLFWGLGVEGFQAEERFGTTVGGNEPTGVVLLRDPTMSEVRSILEQIGSQPNWRVIGLVRDGKPFTQLTGDHVVVHVPQHGDSGWVR